MRSLVQIFKDNNQKLPITILNHRWGNLRITLDKIENIKINGMYSTCDAYTLSENYNPIYGTKEKYKIIGNSHRNTWYTEDEINK